jgi:hypothetical protein
MRYAIVDDLATISIKDNYLNLDLLFDCDNKIIKALYINERTTLTMLRKNGPLSKYIESLR